jgi:hypothetical protein
MKYMYLHLIGFISIVSIDRLDWSEKAVMFSWRAKLKPSELDGT